MPLFFTTNTFPMRSVIHHHSWSCRGWTSDNICLVIKHPSLKKNNTQHNNTTRLYNWDESIKTQLASSYRSEGPSPRITAIKYRDQRLISYSTRGSTPDNVRTVSNIVLSWGVALRRGWIVLNRSQIECRKGRIRF